MLRFIVLRGKVPGRNGFLVWGAYGGPRQRMGCQQSGSLWDISQVQSVGVGGYVGGTSTGEDAGRVAPK